MENLLTIQDKDTRENVKYCIVKCCFGIRASFVGELS
jgi:hypothetical protein